MSVNDTPPSRVGYLDLNELHRGLVPAALDESMFGGVGLRVPYLEGSFPEQWFWSDSSLHIGSDGKLKRSRFSSVLFERMEQCQ